MARAIGSCSVSLKIHCLERSYNKSKQYSFIISSIQSLIHIILFVTPQTATCQAFLYFTISQNLLKLMSIDSVMPSTHLILCCPLLLLPSIFPSSRIFSIKSVLHVRWPKYWSFSLIISSFNEYSGIFIYNNKS